MTDKERIEAGVEFFAKDAEQLGQRYFDALEFDVYEDEWGAFGRIVKKMEDRRYRWRLSDAVEVEFWKTDEHRREDPGAESCFYGSHLQNPALAALEAVAQMQATEKGETDV